MKYIDPTAKLYNIQIGVNTLSYIISFYYYKFQNWTLLHCKDIWGVDNRKGHNYQNHDFELTQLLYAIHHGD